MRRTFRLGSFLILLAGAATWTATAQMRGGMYDQLPVFTEALNTIFSSYVEEMPPEKLLGSAMVGALQAVDPESGYLTPQEYKATQAETAARPGPGLEVTRRGERVLVVAAREGSPAEREGLHPGDLVLKVDGLSTSDLQLWQVMDKLRGPAGSSVVLTVMREGWPAPR